MKKTALFLALLFCVSFVFSYNNHPKIKTTPTSKIVFKKNKSNKTTSGPDFITTWQTTTANESITIPTYPAETYSYTVIWGDGLTSTAQTGNATHTYAAAGTYTVKITGTFPRIYFNNTGDKAKIMTIEQWGTNAWTSMGNSFYGCTHLTSNATDAPDLSNVTDMSQMFRDARAFNGNIGGWNTASVSNMSKMFMNASAFNQNIGTWNTASVTNMSQMFMGASISAFNGNIGGWNTASVSNMSKMFMNASAFNQDISTWNTAVVSNMNAMFMGASVFNQAIGGWNTAAVTDMNAMFYNASVFNQAIGGWNTAMVSTMSNMFGGAGAFNQAIGGWNTAVVSTMSNMFGGASAFNQDISTWNTASVTNMSQMFAASAFNQDISTWNTAAVTNMSQMFYQNTSFNQNIGTWNTAAVTNMSQMFFGASAFNQNIGTWNTAAVTNMYDMFFGASVFNQAIGGWNTASVSDMSYMFINASAFNQDLGGWDISSVTNMSSMFVGITLSTTNYDNTLIGWRTLNTSAGETAIPTGIAFYGGNSQYCAGEAARTALTTTYTWTIADGGKDASCTLAVSDFNLIKSLKLYPNPATEMIYINGDISKIQKLTIYTVQGKQVKSLHKNFKEINVKSLNSGLYFVELMTKEGTRTVKLIKE